VLPRSTVTTLYGSTLLVALSHAGSVPDPSDRIRENTPRETDEANVVWDCAAERCSRHNVMRGSCRRSWREDAQDPPKVSPVRSAEGAEESIRLGCPGRLDVFGHPPALVGQADQYGPSVPYVGLAGHVAMTLEDIDHLGGRPWRNMQPLRQVTQPHRPVRPQYCKGTSVRRRDVPRRQGLPGALPQSPGCRPEVVREAVLATDAFPTWHAE